MFMISRRRFSVLFLFLFLFLPFLVEGTPRGTVCLNMIVKNEEAVIGRCLESVKSFIDYWVIVDTGSSDKTIDVIKEALEGIPGEIYERPWVDFEYNRNQALELAKPKADYIFLIDADESLVFNKEFVEPSLTGEDGYYLTVRQIGAVDFLRCSLIKAKLPWRWEGVLHESLVCDSSVQLGVLKGVINLCNANTKTSGRGLDPNKYAKDAALLEQALLKDPYNARYVYYLAQSYAAAGNKGQALKYYVQRSEMPSFDYQETFFSIYLAGKILESFDDFEEALKWYFKAYSFLPTRAEPLLHAAIVYRKLGNPFLGFLLARHALSMPVPSDTCIEYLVYDYDLLIEYANCALLSERWKEGVDACYQLLNNASLPKENIPLVLSNLKIAQEHLSTPRTLISPVHLQSLKKGNLESSSLESNWLQEMKLQ